MPEVQLCLGKSAPKCPEHRCLGKAGRFWSLPPCGTEGWSSHAWAVQGRVIQILMALVQCLWEQKIRQISSKASLQPCRKQIVFFSPTLLPQTCVSLHLLRPLRVLTAWPKIIKSVLGLVIQKLWSSQTYSVGLGLVGNTERVWEDLCSLCSLSASGDQPGQVCTQQQPHSHHNYQSSCWGKENHHNHKMEHSFHSSSSSLTRSSTGHHVEVHSQISPWEVHNQEKAPLGPQNELCLLNSSLPKAQCLLNILLAGRFPWDMHSKRIHKILSSIPQQGILSWNLQREGAHCSSRWNLIWP